MIDWKLFGASTAEALGSAFFLAGMLGFMFLLSLSNKGMARFSPILDDLCIYSGVALVVGIFFGMLAAIGVEQ